VPKLLLHLLQNGFFTLDMGFLAYALLNIPGVLYRADDALRSTERLKSFNDAVFVFSYDKQQLTL
jgi:hypothetical protein